MRLQELKKKEASIGEAGKEKVVSVFLHSCFYKLIGSWHWDMDADVVFCSDVMISLPADFNGTKSIIHPDELEAVKEVISAGTSKIDYCEFRIITTYGQVKTITGQGIMLDKPDDAVDQWPEELRHAAIGEMQRKAEQARLQLLQQVYFNTERFTLTGTWYHNTATSQTWYSDFVFHVHGLAPQSLNAHLRTFYRFIHPEDIELVTEFIDKAYQEVAPLHFEYRIVIAGSEKRVAYRSQWIFSEKGEPVFCGTLQDVTELRRGEEETEAYRSLVTFQKQQIAFSERHASVGHLQLDLLTRKTIYSDNYYRIFGLKPASLPAHVNSFINYVHPDDQDTVTAAYRKLIYERVAPELEFRVIRPDGNTRYISQRAKVMMYEKEMVVSGIVQDITVQRLLEKKVTELNERVAQKTLQQLQADETAGMAGWVMEIETETIHWNESVNKMLGHKMPVADMSLKTFQSFIHPHDVKTFKDNWTIALLQKQDSGFSFRFVLRGAVRYMKAVLRIHRHGEKEYFIGTVRDVTAENVLEQQLAHRVQLAESLSENIVDRVMITDVHNTILLWNRSCEAAYGIKKADAVGENFFDVFPQLRTEEETQIFQKVLRGEKVTLHGNFSATGNGYYDLYLMPLRTANEVSGILHIVHDVTKETELRNSLHDRLHFIEGLVESSVDRIIALDRNLNYLYWNSRAEAYYGITKSKVVGKNVLEIFPQIRNDPSYGEFRRALKGETVHIPATVEKHKNFETYLIPIKGEKEEVTGVLWIAHDLTRELQLLQQQEEAQRRLKEEHARLKQAETQVKQNKDLLERVFDASLHGIILFKAIRNTKGEIIDYEVVLNNAVTQQWNGRNLVGKRYGQEFPGIRKYGIFEGYTKVLQTGEPLKMEVQYQGEGMDKWFTITAVKLNEDELVATAEDIS
ncbi:MAG TPA: PAS domain S-box protein, partial [Flavisolibacter sp.]|nr:PAS domain S-box protein [Flavisolibacter sp.]